MKMIVMMMMRWAGQNPNTSFGILSVGILSVGIYSYHRDDDDDDDGDDDDDDGDEDDGSGPKEAAVEATEVNQVEHKTLHQKQWDQVNHQLLHHLVHWSIGPWVWS